MPGTTPFPTSALTFCKIDLLADNSDLIRYTQQVLQETNSHKAAIMDSDFWNWQHKSIPGEACVYKALLGETIAGYYHVPVYDAMANGHAARFAMIQDVAVNSEVRGHGVFRKLATFANSDLDKMQYDAIYTFPNNKSKHTFLKYNNFTQVHTLTSYLLPVNAGLVARAKTKIPYLFETILKPVDWITGPRKKNDWQVKSAATITEGMLQLYNEHCSNYKFYTARGKKYLHWRFMERPHSSYYCFTSGAENDLNAVAFFKIDNMMGVPVLLLMDYAHKNAKALSQLINYVSSNAEYLCGSKIAFTFTSVCDINFDMSKPDGMLKIPQKINPRLLNLLVRNLSYAGEDIYDYRNWFVTLADWDVF